MEYFSHWLLIYGIKGSPRNEISLSAEHKFHRKSMDVYLYLFIYSFFYV